MPFCYENQFYCDIAGPCLNKCKYTGKSLEDRQYFYCLPKQTLTAVSISNIDANSPKDCRRKEKPWPVFKAPKPISGEKKPSKK